MELGVILCAVCCCIQVGAGSLLPSGCCSGTGKQKQPGDWEWVTPTLPGVYFNIDGSIYAVYVKILAIKLSFVALRKAQGCN